MLHVLSSVQSKGSSSRQLSSSLAIVLLSNFSAVFHLFLSFIPISMLAVLKLITACPPAVKLHKTLLLHALSLPRSLMQELNVSSHSFLPLVTSGTAFLYLLFLLSMTWTFSKGEYQDVSPSVVDQSTTTSLQRQRPTCFFFKFVIALEILCCKKNC